MVVSPTTYRGTLYGSMSYLSRLANPMTDGRRSKQTEPHHMAGANGRIHPSLLTIKISVSRHFAVLARVTERGVFKTTFVNAS
jgi:hypothetical protein